MTTQPANKLTIELEDVVRLSADGKTFVFNPTAEDSIQKLLALQERVELALAEVKTTIAEQGVAISPAFSGVRGDKVVASYRHYGQAYKLGDVSKIEPAFYVKSVSFRPNSTAIEDHFKKTGSLPTGVVVNERDKVVSLKRK